MAEIVITVSPSCKRGDSDLNWSGRFDARLGERLLLERSRTPLCDGARVLLREGLARSDDRLIMRHAGSPHDALRARVSVAAGLSVAEGTGDGKPRFVKWKPHPFKRGNILLSVAAGDEHVGHPSTAEFPWAP